jgi:hypothetical protein
MNSTPLKTATYQPDILSLLSTKLNKFKRLSDGRFIACCPVHNDKTPSLSISLKPGGVTLMRCFGCGANGQSVCDILGIPVTTLFPPVDNPRYERQIRQGFSAWQLLHALEKDLLVVLVAVKRYLLQGEKPCQSDVDYLTEVCVRINEGLTYLEGKQ